MSCLSAKKILELFVGLLASSPSGVQGTLALGSISLAPSVLAEVCYGVV